jgi:hypothetical protein
MIVKQRSGVQFVRWWRWKVLWCAAVPKFSRKQRRKIVKLIVLNTLSALTKHLVPWPVALAPGICRAWITILKMWLSHTTLNLEHCAATPSNCPTQVQFLKFCPSREGYQIYLHILQKFHNGSGTPSSHCWMGTGVLLPGVKRPESELDHSALSSGGVKNEWLCASTTPCMPSCCAQRQHFNTLCSFGRNQS